ncbi:MAG: macro domain-containing protein [Erysipelotrichaceae bacterium]|nr:macro domain-containing protein [Erysipelotrichaceae bacterium]
MPFTIVREEMERMNTEAIVRITDNTAGIKLQGCKGMPFRYVMDTALPLGNKNEEKLRTWYRNILKSASMHKLKSLAFPLVSSGDCPDLKEPVLRIVNEEVREFLNQKDMDLVLVIEKDMSLEISEETQRDIEAYIDEMYTGNERLFERGVFGAMPEMAKLAGRSENKAIGSMPEDVSVTDELSYLLNHMDAGFRDTLLSLMDKTGKKDSEIYKKANVDRRLFSKIVNNKNYRPSKETALAFAFALELTVPQTNQLLSTAGYTLSHSSKADIVAEYFLKHGIYDLMEVNEYLFSLDLPIIGGK